MMNQEFIVSRNSQMALEEKLKFYRLTPEEYQKAKNNLGRDLNEIEWCLFSALWSEHCSYKSSKVHLRKFNYRNASTPNMDGENAGLVDLGFEEKIIFKMESHNHPSFIEPVQGAATGVGGILRDIFTMGARPIALANYLCFGESTADRMNDIEKGVVHGISMYGNCVGVPMLTGKTQKHSKYNTNVLVNAMAVGYLGPQAKLATAQAAGVGNYVVYVGAQTGRDGIHGASMASASFDQDSESKKPTIQIGDPFFEKLLIESCLEVLEKNLVVAMQDMGAAGLTSSSFEMAFNGKCGFDLQLDQVPLRDPTLTPEEILLSESQERMLLIVKPENLSALKEVFHRWNLESQIIGTVIEKPVIRLKWKNQLLTEVNPAHIVDQAPRYERPFEKWHHGYQVQSRDLLQKSEKKQIPKVIQAEKNPTYEWIYKQFDQRVGCRTAQDCSAPIGFVQLDSSKRGLAIGLGCRVPVMEMDAFIGGLDAIYYPAFQMALQGAKPMAATDCLNFGNPQKVKIMSEFVASVEAIALASQKLDAPVISGNVSFYNETNDQNIVSTPAVGVVGLRSSVEDLIPSKISESLNMILVTYHWIETNLENFDTSKKQFYMSPDAKPDQFILKCVLLDQEIKNQDIPIQALRAVSLDGVVGAVEKMLKPSLQFQFDPRLDLEQFKNQHFYQFLLATSDSDRTIQFLKTHFKEESGFMSFLDLGFTTAIGNS